MFRKGSVLYRTKVSQIEEAKSGAKVERMRPVVVKVHDDFIGKTGDEFWQKEDIEKWYSEE
jgi:hypothetical protein